MGKDYFDKINGDASARPIESPAVGAFAITPSNATVFDGTGGKIPPRSLYVGGAGNVAVVMLNGTSVTFSGVAAGTTLPIRVKQVLATGTTATMILGLY
jgi:hypothetical protein